MAGALAVVATLAFGSSQASAATEVTLNEQPGASQLFMADMTSDDDAITLSVSGNTITIVDTGTNGITTTDLDCTAVNPQTVTCPLDPPDPAPPASPTAPVEFVFLEMRNGNDSFTNQNFDVFFQENDGAYLGNKTVVGGPGNDQIVTGQGDDTISTGDEEDGVSSGPGNDTVSTGAARDFAGGGPGNDSLDMGAGAEDSIQEEPFPNGADTLNGGPGPLDRISYSGGFLPVTIKANGLPDDGHVGEGDNIVGIEAFTGSNAADVMEGDGSDNLFEGGEGDDTMIGGGGDDRFFPDEGNDSVDGGDGADFVSGGNQTEEGADKYNGGAGSGDVLEYSGPAPVTMTLNNQADDGRAGEGDNIAAFEGLTGGEGADTIVGDAANNLLDGNDGADTITGGPGTDVFLAGNGDDVLLALGGRDQVGCGLGLDTPIHDADDILNGDCERRGAEVVSDSATVSKKGKGKVKVSCPAEQGATCKGTLVLLSNGKQIGSGKFSVAKGKAKGTTVKLTKKGKKALAKSGNSLTVRAEARTKLPQGTSTNADRLELEAKARGKKKRGGKGR